ncbi:carbonyl reductase [NADPH] 3-like [Achroia grisella]|uniref:carbonyl reductase [NADPH] 3-like n=1 Tax=Achroia grisella TaxID=688607 RepID=UPI0027D314A9|nr:carbonyl reductase [NADPH] 3-like [Achroia grisella]
MQKICVLTDADKGVGLNICRLLCRRCPDIFYVTTRDIEVGQQLMDKLKEMGSYPEYHQLDVSDRESVTRFRDHIQSKNGCIVTLINNVAIGARLNNTTYDDAKFIIDNYYYGYVNVQEVLFPLLASSGRVLYLSLASSTSRIMNDYWRERLSMKHLRQNDINDFLQWFLETMKTGDFTDNYIADDKVRAIYSISTVSLTLLVKLQQKQLAPRSISVNFLHPRWAQIY